MTRRMRRGPAPPWWPEGEAWPPHDAAFHWRRRRARFMGRVALVFSLVWLLSAFGAATIMSWLAGTSAGPGGRAWLLIVVATVAFAGFAFVAVVRRIGSPLGDLVTAAHRVAAGDFSARVSSHGPPALRAVATAFNDMAERLAIQEQQRRELMADIAHELRTPLSIVQGRLEGLVDGVYPREASELEPLLEETRLLTRLVEDLRTLANAESGLLSLEREPTDIDMLIRDAVSAIRTEAEQRGVTVSVVDSATAPTVNVDPVRIRQVLLNLLANAVRHSGPGTAVHVDARVENGRLIVRVADRGAGIPADELPRIFDRFYKGRGSSGSGLGLTIARTLVRAHGGEITAESRVGSGTTITFSVPAA